MNKLKEIARIQHEEIMRPFLNNLISKCFRNDLNLVIPTMYEDRLIRIAHTKFDDLTLEEQEGDLVQIEKMLAVLGSIPIVKTISKEIDFTDSDSKIFYTYENVCIFTCINAATVPNEGEHVTIKDSLYVVDLIVNEVDTDTVYVHLKNHK